jgi:tachylectin
MRRKLIFAIASIVMALAIAGSLKNPTSVHSVSPALTASGDLLWYRHDGRGDGSFKWADNNARKVDTGWDFKHLFYGGDGIIYAINANNDLLWYRHDGRDDGSVKWADDNPRKIGTGWNFKHVFYGGDGIIYAVNANNDLLWYRHDGRDDGSVKWADGNARKIGTGWNFKQLFYGGDGVIYAVSDTPATAAPTPRPGGLEPPRTEQLPTENVTCRDYAYRAIDQYKLTLKYPKCRVKNEGRWMSDYKAHYNWCLTATAAARINEQKERDKHLTRCGAQFTYD